jgi:hypothetical protein
LESMAQRVKSNIVSCQRQRVRSIDCEPNNWDAVVVDSQMKG